MYQECILNSFEVLIKDGKVTVPSNVTKHFRLYLESNNVPYIQVKSGWQLDRFGRYNRLLGNVDQFLLSEFSYNLP